MKHDWITYEMFLGFARDSQLINYVPLCSRYPQFLIIGNGARLGAGLECFIGKFDLCVVATQVDETHLDPDASNAKYRLSHSIRTGH